MADIVKDTAALLSVSPRIVFQMAADHMGLKSSSQIGEERHNTWIHTGSIPKYVVEWCLSQWGDHFRMLNLDPQGTHV